MLQNQLQNNNLLQQTDTQSFLIRIPIGDWQPGQQIPYDPDNELSELERLHNNPNNLTYTTHQVHSTNDIVSFDSEVLHNYQNNQRMERIEDDENSGQIIEQDQDHQNRENQDTNSKAERIIIKRKDPLWESNRFKFNQEEDETLIINFLEKISYQQKLLQEFDDWKFFMPLNFPQRHQFEVVRRSLELIKEYQKGHKQNKSNRDVQADFSVNAEEQIDTSTVKHYKQNQDHCKDLILGPKKMLKQIWTPEEDKTLLQCVQIHGEKWTEIKYYFEGKISNECRQRYVSINPNVIRTWWNFTEDVMLMFGVKFYGEKRWALISELVFKKTRNDMQCRERYCNILNPKLQDKEIQELTDEEVEQLKVLVDKYGLKWSKLAKELGGNRTDNQIKRIWKRINKAKKKKKGSRLSSKNPDSKRKQLKSSQNAIKQKIETQELDGLQNQEDKTQNQVIMKGKKRKTNVKNIEAIEGQNKNIKKKRVKQQIEAQNQNNPEVSQLVNQHEEIKEELCKVSKLEQNEKCKRKTSKNNKHQLIEPAACAQSKKIIKTQKSKAISKKRSKKN
eukprot:403364121